MKQRLQKMYNKDGQDRLLPRLSLFLFNRPRAVAVAWVLLTVLGVFSYTTFLQREGFPSVNIPFSVVRGTYFVNDPAKVDREVAKPISDIVLKDERVKMVRSSAQGSFYSVIVQYDENVRADAAGKQLEKQIADAGILPKQATIVFETPKFGFTERGDDGVISVYAKDADTSLEELTGEGGRVAQYIKDQRLADIESVSIIDPFVTGTDVTNGNAAALQTRFDRYGVREGSENTFYNSVAVGFLQKDGTDVIALNDQVEAAVAKYNQTYGDDRFESVVSASFAHDIKDQISELQRVLLEGLIAVLVIGSIVIALRASLITVIAMITVLAISLGALYLMGQTLNTITLFALILCLALIVDDTIIMVEALDAQRRRLKNPREAVRVATRKVSRAMVAATLTAALSFAPLLFVGGILGSFIRAIPLTVITALLVSLFVALVFIPFFARYLLLGKKQMGAKHIFEPAANIEAKVASFIGKPMLWARGSTARLFGVGITAVVLGLAFIGMGGYFFQKVTFNIFPPTKDSNGVVVQLDYAPGTTIAQAEALADKADKITGDGLGQYFRYGTYYANATAQSATLMTYITPYAERDITAPQLVAQLKEDFKGFEGARVTVRQQDVGPPTAAFSVRIETTDREAGMRLAEDIKSFLAGTELTRPSGETARITSTTVSDPGIYGRADGKPFVEVGATFDGDDTTTLVTLAQNAVNKEFPADKLAKYGLGEDVLKYDFGQETENQESFKTLLFAFPILLLAIYLLLALQFRSLLQPLLIFMAIPFSLFGIALGLYATDNPFSFFAMLGFFALIGLSIKNTILLTDYANQLRRAGSGAIDAAVGALAERFRPLIATSFTAVVSLIPLALSSPFWEGLAVLLICGLLSSTFLVITVFPYYYLGAEFLRMHISRKTALSWLAFTIVTSVALGATGQAQLIPVAILGVTVLMILLARRRRQKAA